MQAFQISYSPDDSLVALGWPNGLVEISTVDPADGSPRERVVALFAHKREITFVAFVGDRLISVDEKGKVVVTAVPSGKVVHQTSVGGEYVGAALSPSGRTLFLFAYRGDRDSNTFAIDLSTYRMTYGPDVDPLSTQARVFGVDDRRAAYYFVAEDDDDDDIKVDALATVDFDSGEITIRKLVGGPASTFGGPPPFALDVASGVGVRIGYGHPLELVKLDGKDYVGLQLEVFDATTLAVRRTFRAIGLEADKALIKVLKKGELDHDAYLEKRKEMIDRITSIAIAAGGRYVFVGSKGGAVRRLPIDGSKGGAWMVHGRIEDPTTNTLDDVFGRNIRNNQTLGVSASGRYVAFGNPNEFFNADTADHASGTAVRLPKREAAAITPPPQFVGSVGTGAGLVLGLPGENARNVMVVDVAARSVEFAIGVEYGSDLRDATRSAKGDELVLAYAGRNSLRVRAGGTEIVELPLPPHTMYARHLADGRVVLVHHNGAVTVIDGDRLHAFRKEGSSDDDDGDEDDYEDEDASYNEDGEDEDGDEGEASDGAGGDGEDEAVPGVPWKLHNPPGVDPLMLFEQGDGEVMIVNDYFEQRDDVFDVAHARVDGVDLVLILMEGGTLDTYRIGDDRIHHVSEVSCIEGRTIAAAGSYAAVCKPDPGNVEVFRLSATGPESILAFDLPGVRLAAPAADGTLVIFEQETGMVSSLDLATMRERALLAYVGPVLGVVRYDPASNRLVIVEDTGSIVVIDLARAAVDGVLRVLGDGEDRRIDFAGQPVGQIEPRDQAIDRAYPGAGTGTGTGKKNDGDDDDEDDGDGDAAEKALGKQVDAVLAAYNKASAKAKRVELLTAFLAPYEDASYDATAGGRRRTDIGRCFTIRGCVRIEQKLVAEAEADFRRGLAFHYWKAYDELLDLLAIRRPDPAGAIRIADEILVSRDAKKAIGLRSSLPVYRSMLHALVMAGDAGRARFIAQQVVENLLPFLKEDDDDEDDKKKKQQKAKTGKPAKTKAKAAKGKTRPPSAHDKHLRLLSTILDDLRAMPRPHAGLAVEIVGGIDAMLASYPAELAKNDAGVASLEAVKATAQFLEKNDRLAEIPPRLDRVLVPHERSRYHTLALSSSEKHKLGDLFGLRGKARAATGDAAGAAADFEKAIEFREVCHYVDAIELYLGPLARPDDVVRLVDHAVTSPFNWASEWYSPLSELDYAYVLAARAIVDRTRGRTGSVDTVRRLYPGVLGALADRLERAIVAPGHAAAPAAAAVIAELRA